MNLNKFLLPAFLLTSACAVAQTHNDSRPAASTDNITFKMVDVMPKAPYDLNEYLGAQLHYPDSARAHHVEGRVVIKFVVNKKGGIEQSTVVKGIGSGCDEEALRVVSHMPAWKPGEQNGQPVAVYFSLPISFKLAD